MSIPANSEAPQRSWGNLFSDAAAASYDYCIGPVAKVAYEYGLKPVAIASYEYGLKPVAKASYEHVIVPAAKASYEYGLKPAAKASYEHVIVPAAKASYDFSIDTYEHVIKPAAIDAYTRHKEPALQWAGETITKTIDLAVPLIAEKAESYVCPEAAVYFKGRDLKPLLLEKSNTLLQDNSEKLKGWSNGVLGITPSSQTSLASESQQTSNVETQPTEKPSATSPPLTTSFSAKTQALKQEDAQFKRHALKAKKEAAKTLYPILANYSKAYWLFTSTLGIELDPAGKYNQVLMTFVSRLKKENNNEFSMSIFRKTLQSNKINPIKLSFFQKVKLSLANTFLASWTVDKLVPIVADKAFDNVYETLFGNNGKDQKKLLNAIFSKTPKFMEKYIGYLDRYEEAKARNTTDFSEQEFIADLIKHDFSSSIYTDFTAMIVDNFVPKIDNNLFNTALKNFKAATLSNPKYKSGNIFYKFIYYAWIVPGYYVSAVPVYFLSFFCSFVDKITKRFCKSILKDIGPTIVDSTLDALQSPVTQLSINESFLDLLKDQKAQLSKPSTTGEEDVTFSSTPVIDDGLLNLSKSIYKLLKRKLGKITLHTDSSNHIVANLMKLANLASSTPYVNDRISEEMTAILEKQIPSSVKSFLANYLHPKMFTNNILFKIMNTTIESFAPSKPLDKEKEAKVNAELNTVIEDIVKISIDGLVEEQLGGTSPDHRLTKKQNEDDPSKVEYISPDNSVLRSDQVLDLEEHVDDIIRPIVREQCLPKVFELIYDENFLRIALNETMQIFNSSFR